MIEEIKAKIKEGLEDPNTIANFRVMRRVAERLRNELNYSDGLAAEVVMSMNLVISDDAETEDLAVELLGDTVILADKMARMLTGRSCPSAVLEATRKMDFSM